MRDSIEVVVVVHKNGNEISRRQRIAPFSYRRFAESEVKRAYEADRDLGLTGWTAEVIQHGYGYMFEIRLMTKYSATEKVVNGTHSREV